MRRPGHIYLVRLWEDTDPLKCAYKIGRSKDVPERHKEIGIKMPYETTVVHTISVSDMYWAESFMHELLCRQRLDGEWFWLTQNLLDWICSLKAFEPDDYKGPMYP